MTLTTERLREIAERRSPSLRWGEAEKIAAELLVNREAKPVGYTSAAALDLLSHGQSALIHKDAETTTFIEEEYRDVVPLFTYAPAVASGENCWSCGKFFTYAQHSECDGYCPHCDAPVDLDEGEEGTAPPAPAVPQDYFGALVEKARVSADKAMQKYPQPNYVLNKVAEESGEVIKAVIHYTEGREEWANVEGEIIDNLAMLIRLVIEGDQVIGFTPPDACRAAMLIHVGDATDKVEPVMICDTCGHDADHQGNRTYKCDNGHVFQMRSEPVSQGYKLVPIEPTPKQWAAGVKAMDAGMDKVTLVYKAMLATAPTQGENQ